MQLERLTGSRTAVVLVAPQRMEPREQRKRLRGRERLPHLLGEVERLAQIGIRFGPAAQVDPVPRRRREQVRQRRHGARGAHRLDRRCDVRLRVAVAAEPAHRPGEAAHLQRCGDPGARREHVDAVADQRLTLPHVTGEAERVAERDARLEVGLAAVVRCELTRLVRRGEQHVRVGARDGGVDGVGGGRHGAGPPGVAQDRGRLEQSCGAAERVAREVVEVARESQRVAVLGTALRPAQHLGHER